jgi:hypothetical protein
MLGTKLNSLLFVIRGNPCNPWLMCGATTCALALDTNGRSGPRRSWRSPGAMVRVLKQASSGG